jgi:erythrocyte band 7 integral membrane protein
LYQILSRDSVTVTVDAVVYYRVSNPTMATNNVEDYGHSTHLLGATTLRSSRFVLKNSSTSTDASFF